MIKKIGYSIVVLLIFLVLLSVGIFSLSLGLNITDSFYFVTTILTSVGFGDISLLNASALMKWYGSFLMIAGILGIAILSGIITDYLVKLRLDKYFGKRRKKMKNHTILIGWNKTAKATLDELHKISDVTIISNNKEITKQVRYKNVGFTYGDATEDYVLKKAGIDSAKIVITCEENDSRNIMITLMVKKINPKIKVISSANEVPNMKILKEAGANDVISPDVLGGRLLTSAIFEPNVVELIKDATYVGDGNNIEEIRLKIDTNVKDVMDRFNISVLEVVRDKKRDSKISSNVILKKDDIILVYGLIQNIKNAQKRLS